MARYELGQRQYQPRSGKFDHHRASRIELDHPRVQGIGGKCREMPGTASGSRRRAARFNTTTWNLARVPVLTLPFRGQHRQPWRCPNFRWALRRTSLLTAVCLQLTQRTLSRLSGRQCSRLPLSGARTRARPITSFSVGRDLSGPKYLASFNGVINSEGGGIKLLSGRCRRLDKRRWAIRLKDNNHDQRHKSLLIIGGSTTDVHSSATNTMVPVDDAGYVEWAANKTASHRSPAKPNCSTRLRSARSSQLPAVAAQRDRHIHPADARRPTPKNNLLLTAPMADVISSGQAAGDGRVRWVTSYRTDRESRALTSIRR